MTVQRNSKVLLPLVNHLKDQIKTEQPGAYRATILPLQALQLDELVLDLTVPSELHRKRFQPTLLSRLEELASEYLDRQVQVRITVSQQQLDTHSVAGGTVGALTDRNSDRMDGAETIDLRTSGDLAGQDQPAPGMDTSNPEVSPAKASKSSSGPVNGDYTFDNFVIGGSNQFAQAAAVAASEAPGEKYTPLFIYGDSGLGKTHLLRAFQHNVNHLFPDKTAMFITTEEYLNQFVAAIGTNTVPAFASKIRRLDVLLIDDIQFIANKGGLQEELFHTLNTLYDLGSQVVISCDSKPEGIVNLEDRLRTRFSQGLVVDIKPPDVETRMAILQALAERIGFWLPNEVADLIANRVADNVRSLEGALRHVYARSNLFNDPITIELTESVLQDLLPTSQAQISLALILEKTAEVSGYTEDQILSGSRKRALVQYRKIAMHLSREMTNHSLAELGSFFDRDHSTVLHAVRSSEDLLAARAEFFQRYTKVQRAIQDKLRSAE